MDIEETAVIVLQSHLCIYYMPFERSINSAD